MTRKALVTGAAGFVGSHVTTELEKRDWYVQRCDITYHGTHNFLADFVDSTKWNSTRYDLVVHCAAVAPHRAAIDGQPYTFAQNMQLDASLFEWAIRTRQRRVLYISSSAAYPVEVQQDPDRDIRLAEYEIDLDYPELADSHYGFTKLAGEHLARAARACGVPVTVVRPFSGYGESQGTDWPFGAFVQRIRNHENPFTIWGSAKQRRDWIHIDDVVRGMLDIAQAQEDGQNDGEPVNLCTGQATSMGDLVRLMMGEIDNALEYVWPIVVDETKPLGVLNRVGDPHRFGDYYDLNKLITIEEGVHRALKSSKS